MADDADTPPFHWLFGRSGRQRQAVQYWVGDTAKGLLSIAVHTGLKALPIDACSAFGAMLAKNASRRYAELDSRARENLKRLRPEQSDQASVDATMVRLWRSVARTRAELSVLERLWRAGRIAVSCFETDYASFIAWYNWNCPDPTVYSFFAVAALRAAGGGYLVGEMAPYTVGAGRLYFPGGTPDPSDIDDRGAFDPLRHLSRELREETGIDIDELDAEPGWILMRDRCSVALIRRLKSRKNADDLRRQVIRHISGEQQPELSDMRIVRGPAQLDARMPTFVMAFLQEQWRQGTAKIY